MHGYGGWGGGAFFWLVILGIVWLNAWYRGNAERERQQTIRAAIEKGQQLDPALLEKILRGPEQSSHQPHLLTGGIIVSSVGLGLGVLGLVLSHSEPQALWPVTGAGALVFIVGMGIVLAAVLRGKPKGAAPDDRV